VVRAQLEQRPLERVPLQQVPPELPPQRLPPRRLPLEQQLPLEEEPPPELPELVLPLSQVQVQLLQSLAPSPCLFLCPAAVALFPFLSKGCWAHLLVRLSVALPLGPLQSPLLQALSHQP